MHSLSFSPDVPRETRKKVLVKLRELGCVYDVGANNTYRDASRGEVPMVDWVRFEWNFPKNIFESEFYKNLPEGCTVK